MWLSTSHVSFLLPFSLCSNGHSTFHFLEINFWSISCLWITQCLFNVCLISLHIKFCIAANVRIFFYNKKTFCSVQMSFLSSAAHLLMVLWALAIANIATVVNMFSTWLFHLLCTYTQECGFWVRWSFYPFPHREQPLCFLQWFCFVSTATLYKISISSTFLSKHVILCLLGIIIVSSEKQNLTLSLMCIFLIIILIVFTNILAVHMPLFEKFLFLPFPF